MNAEEYYRKIKAKWQNEYPSPKNLEEVWNFYKECGYNDPQQTLSRILDKIEWRKNRVLDYGCDNGLMLKFICDEYPSVAGSVSISIRSR